MSEPNEYRAIKALQTALLAITTVGGYHFNVAALAVKLDPNQAYENFVKPGGPRPLMMIELRPDNWQLLPASQIRLVLPVTIHWISDSVPTDDDSRMLTYLRGLADIERAVFHGTTPAGLGTYATVPPRMKERRFDTAIDGSQVWAQADVELVMHRTYGEPDI